MVTITLKPDVAEEITQLTAETQDSVEDLVNKAVRAYLSHMRREKIRTEAEAFERQRASLLATYRGEYVAMHQGQVIDHDPDLRTLHLRVFAQLGHAPVLLKQVTQEPAREIVFRSPHFERAQP